jgi:RND family efflux transporter MFP subunit
VEGRVFERFVDVGDHVQAGQPLVQLLTETIKLELQGAQAELRLREFELQELENGARTNEISQAQAKMLAAEANAKFALLQKERLQKLTRSDAVPKAELDQAIAAYDQTLQSYLDLKAGYELIHEGPRREQVEQARARMDIQRSIVEQIQDRIKKYTISSRFDGYVVSQFVEVGAWVRTGDPVMEVVHVDEVELMAYVGEGQVEHIQAGQTVRVEIPSIGERDFNGIVRSVIPQADMQARTFPVVVRVKNEVGTNGPVLKPGQLARVDLPIGSKQSALLVPKDALVLGGSSPLVYVVEQINSQSSAKVVPVEVTIGRAVDDLIQVQGRLQAGQMVVVEGNERLRPGQEVIVMEKN